MQWLCFITRQGEEEAPVFPVQADGSRVLRGGVLLPECDGNKTQAVAQG